MATVLRGKNKGKTVTISQWCNDWISTKEGKIYGVSTLEFTDSEIFSICESNNTGVMFEEFEKVPNKNRFRRKKREQIK